MKILVTGGAGFIGSCFVLQRIEAGDQILNLDKLTYSGNLMNLVSVENSPLYSFRKGDIGDEELVKTLLQEFMPDAIVNFAAETHVDRSIVDPDAFVRTNVMGTSVLLRCVKEWWDELPHQQKESFRFHHISTDEVFGTLSMTDPAFTEQTPFAPNSPYSASKASSDHFVRAFHETYGLPTLITNCSNNYGCARARKWNGFSRKVERLPQLMERLTPHKFSQNGTAFAPTWNAPLSNWNAPMILP